MILLGCLCLLASYFFFLPCVEPMVRRRQGGRLSKEERAALRRGLICSGTLLAAGACMALSGIFAA